MQKKDRILVILVLAVAAGFYLWNMHKSKQAGNQVVVTVDGKEYGVYALEQDNEIEISSQYGTNHLVIKDAKAYMKDADCPDQYCVDKGKIEKNGETLICLPHKLVVEIQAENPEEAGEETPSLDAVAK